MRTIQWSVGTIITNENVRVGMVLEGAVGGDPYKVLEIRQDGLLVEKNDRTSIMAYLGRVGAPLVAPFIETLDEPILRRCRPAGLIIRPDEVKVGMHLSIAGHTHKVTSVDETHFQARQNGCVEDQVYLKASNGYVLAASFYELVEEPSMEANCIPLNMSKIQSQEPPQGAAPSASVPSHIQTSDELRRDLVLAQAQLTNANDTIVKQSRIIQELRHELEDTVAPAPSEEVKRLEAETFELRVKCARETAHSNTLQWNQLRDRAERAEACVKVLLGMPQDPPKKELWYNYSEEASEIEAIVNKAGLGSLGG